MEVPQSGPLVMGSVTILQLVLWTPAFVGMTFWVERGGFPGKIGNISVEMGIDLEWMGDAVLVRFFRWLTGPGGERDFRLPPHEAQVGMVSRIPLGNSREYREFRES